jgi:hypothetical protein
MSNHHSDVLHLTVALSLIVISKWVHLFELGGWFFQNLVPYLAFIVVVGQLIVMYRKFRRR